MKKIIYLCVLSILTIPFTACSNKNSSENNEEKTLDQKIIENDSRYDASMQRTQDDSIKIIQLANQYLSLLQQNKVDEALSMLQEIDDSANIKPISDSYKSTLKKQLLIYPVLSYQIVDLKIYGARHTDLHYSYEFMQKLANGNLPNTMKGILNPCRIDGNWYLTVNPYSEETQMNTIDNSKYN